MIKAEVVFDGDRVVANNHSIYCGVIFTVCKTGVILETFETLEQAIKYCMEN